MSQGAWIAAWFAVSLVVALALPTSAATVVCEMGESDAAEIRRRGCVVQVWEARSSMTFYAAVTIRNSSHSAKSDVIELCGLDPPHGSRRSTSLVCFVDWDIDSLMASQQGDSSSSRRQQQISQVPSFSSASQVVARMTALKRRFPGLVTLFTIGTTAAGETIKALRISCSTPLSSSSVSPAQVLITGNMHAREWIATEIAIGFAEFVLDRFHINPDISALFVHESVPVEVWVIPILNVDGVVYTFESGVDESGADKRFWRKNRRQFDGVAFRGVDLNRNFPIAFGGASSSGAFADETFRGPEALSEPENRALVQLLQNKEHFPNVIAHVSFHSFGREILYPLGSSTGVFGPNEPLLAALGVLMADGMTASGGQRYRVTKAANSYPVGGDSVDYIYSTFGYFPAYTVEARPGPTECCGFVIDPALIPIAVKENAFAVLTLIHAAADIARRSAGGKPNWAALGVTAVNASAAITNWTHPCEPALLSPLAPSTAAFWWNGSAYPVVAPQRVNASGCARQSAASGRRQRSAVSSPTESVVLEWRGATGNQSARTETSIVDASRGALTRANIRVFNSTALATFFRIVGMRSAQDIENAVREIDSAIAAQGDVLLTHAGDQTAVDVDVDWRDMMLRSGVGGSQTPKLLLLVVVPFIAVLTMM